MGGTAQNPRDIPCFFVDSMPLCPETEAYAQDELAKLRVLINTTSHPFNCSNAREGQTRAERAHKAVLAEQRAAEQAAAAAEARRLELERQARAQAEAIAAAERQRQEAERRRRQAEEEREEAQERQRAAKRSPPTISNVRFGTTWRATHTS